jgi:hypothetical protein
VRNDSSEIIAGQALISMRFEGQVLRKGDVCFSQTCATARTGGVNAGQTIMTTPIAFFGKTLVAGPDVPPELRQQLEQLVLKVQSGNDQAGTGVLEASSSPAIKIATSHQIVVNGHRYGSLEEMPPAERQLFEQLRSLLLEQTIGQGQTANTTTGIVPGLPPDGNTLQPRPVSPDALNSLPTFLSPGREESQLSWLIQFFVLLFGIGVGLVIAVAVWSALK